MKKFLVALTAAAFIASAPMAIAGDDYKSNGWGKTDASIDIHAVTPEWMESGIGNNGNEDAWMGTGYAGYDIEAEGKGNFLSVAAGNGKAKMDAKGFAGQKEIDGGELSYAVGTTESKTRADAFALGVDSPWRSCQRDYAEVDIEVFGQAVAKSRAYSDDRDSYIGGGASAGVTYWAQTDAYDYGSGRRDYTAFASDHLSAEGNAFSGTVLYAKQTATKATVAGITGGYAVAKACNAEHFHASSFGNGGLGGVAQIPGSGYAAFTAEYEYEGLPNGSGGIAGGFADTNITNTRNGGVSVSSSAAAFSAAGTPDFDFGEKTPR